jgi:hypothetical protein
VNYQLSLINSVLTLNFRKDKAIVYDFSDELNRYYETSVNLQSEQREEMRDRRDSNRSRLTSRMKDIDATPTIKDFIIQGSYAMKTMVQDPNNDYDIDDGVVFSESDPNLKSPLKMRELICEALQDARFNDQPAVKDNCVRVFYDGGYHIDVPVYKSRESVDILGNNKIELKIASKNEWLEADPKGVTGWFQNLEKRSPITDLLQLRKVVQFLKVIAKTIKPKSPSGLIVSKLVEECYLSNSRLDLSLKQTIDSISQRLQSNLNVKHPVQNRDLTRSDSEKFMKQFRDRLIEISNILNAQINTCGEATEAWNSVFPAAEFVAETMKNDNNNSAGIISNDRYSIAGDLTKPLTMIDKDGETRYA